MPVVKVKRLKRPVSIVIKELEQKGRHKKRKKDQRPFFSTNVF
jgi:hypothetical protein